VVWRGNTFDDCLTCEVFSPASEFGTVVCDGVPLADVPLELQESRVFHLSLRNNGLQRFPDAKLSGSGEFHIEMESSLPVKLVFCGGEGEHGGCLGAVWVPSLSPDLGTARISKTGEREPNFCQNDLWRRILSRWMPSVDKGTE